MVIFISIILSFPSIYLNFLSSTYFVFLCYPLCASLTCFSTRFLCMGSGLDLNVFHICFLMFSFLQFILLMCASFKIIMSILIAIKKELLGDNPLYLYFLLFFFLLSLGNHCYCNDLSLSVLFRFCTKNFL